MEHVVRVVVVGGGYAGIIAANRLRTREDVAITVWTAGFDARTWPPAAA